MEAVKDKEPQVNRLAAMDSIVSELTARLTEQQAKRTEVEERWLADLQQYHSQYPPKFKSKLDAQAEATGSSSIFVNQTRPKCNIGESRVGDMLFPVDARNWAMDLPAERWSAEQGDPQSQEIMDDSKDRAKRMQGTIDGQLQDSDYNRKGRDCIHDAVVLGTGVLRGPVTMQSPDKSWQQVAEGVYEMVMIQNDRPGVVHVNLWDFFPDMSARGAQDLEFAFERDYLTRLQVQKMQKEPGYRKTRQQIKDVLTIGPGISYIGQDRRQQVRAISGVTGEDDKNKFERWRYYGPVKRELLQTVGMDGTDDDDRDEIPIYCEFIGNKLIKFNKLPLDTEEYPYSIFTWFQADETPFGFGIPWSMRSSQSAINSSWRAMLDNAALSAGPQIVLDENAIEPADAQWALSPRKVWRKLQSAVTKSVRDVFAVFDIPSFQPELMAIYQEAKELANEETSLPPIAQGFAPNVQQTQTQSSMQMNSATAPMRRTVKNWDDDITKPLMTRFYDWNMQYNTDETIKVDAVVKPRGTSTLLVKETQSAAIMGMINTCQTPILAPLCKFPDMLRTAWETLHINPDDYVKTDTEIESEQQEAQQQPPKPDPTVEAKLTADMIKSEQDNQARVAMNEQDNRIKLLTTRMNNQNKVMVEMMKLAAQGEIADDQMDAKYAEMMLKLETGSGI